MPHKKRKTREKRGSRTHGYGITGQHRCGGQRGGRGKTGGHKHEWTYTVKYEPNRYGKHGFKLPLRREVKAINVGELDQQISQLITDEKAENTRQGIEVDLGKLGYDKLLGRGHVTKPVIIHVSSHSESAAKKVEKAGGKILKPIQ